MRPRQFVIAPYALAAVATVVSMSNASALDCTGTPQYRFPTGQIIQASAYGAYPDDGIDDTAAIQTALDNLLPGQELRFQPGGVYQHNTALHLRRPNINFNGNDAVFVGTNPDNQALMIEADGVQLANAKIKNVVDSRRTAPRHAAIAIVSSDDGKTTLHNIRVIFNQITADPPQQGAAAQASSSGGVYVARTDNFVISNNYISRSVADGVHVTKGSRNGRVMNNFIEEGGDDGVGIVSQIEDTWLTQAKASSTYFATTTAANLDDNIFVYNNTVTGNYWGRGIAVVGGRNITIDNNAVNKITRQAGIMLAHESNYNSFGTSNVLVKNNTVFKIRNTAPTFVPSGPGFATLNATLAGPNNSGHAALDVIGKVDDGAPTQGVTGVWETFAVRDSLFLNNNVMESYGPGIRVGADSSHLGKIGYVDNVLNTPWTVQVLSSGTFDYAPYCLNNNIISGSTPAYGTCASTNSAPVVTGFTCNAGQL